MRSQPLPAGSPGAILWRLLLVLTLIAGMQRTDAAGSRTNVLLICVDDLKPLLGCYGERGIRTPNLDRLASRGLRFDAAYCNQAVCAPSRNALLTGRRPQTTGIYDLGTHFRDAEPDAVTLPQHFLRHGYRTESLGKIFHVGHGNRDDPASWSVPSVPGTVVAYALPQAEAAGGLTREEALFSNLAWDAARRLPRGAAWESADVPDDAYPDGQIAAEAVLRLRAAADRQNPFFLAVGFVKPHLPFCAPRRYWDLYDPAEFDLPERSRLPDGAPGYAGNGLGELRQYAPVPDSGPVPPDIQRSLLHGYHAAVSYIDTQIGRVIDELDRLDLARSTVIVVWGDHGWHLGDHGQWCKHTNYEQAARIPLLIIAPGVTVPGGHTRALVETVDIYPTLVELAGLPPAGNPLPLDGRSLVPVLRDPSAPGRDAVLHAYPRHPGNRALIGRALRTDRYRLVEWKVPGAAPETADLELYDYLDDPAETRNLAEERPETVVRLRARLAKELEARPQVRR